MSWHKVTVMSQKEEFVKLALANEKPFSHLCNDYGISRETGYQLLKRYNAEGLSGLNERSRAPHHNPTKTLRKIEEKILTVRAQYPTWGARKIRTYLSKHGVKQLPAPSTITQILKRCGHIFEEESLKRQAFIQFERDSPNDLWQMDFKGKFQLQSQQSCYPLTIIDDHSRFSLCLKACGNEQFITVKKQLIHTFEQYGLPAQFK
jgi:transposase InsO family protein